MNKVMIRFGATIELTDEQLSNFKEHNGEIIQDVLKTRGIMLDEDSYVPENDFLDLEEFDIAPLNIRIRSK